MPNISAGSSKVAKTGFTTNQYVKRKGSTDLFGPGIIVDPEDLVLWYDFTDPTTLFSQVDGTGSLASANPYASNYVRRVNNKSTSSNRLGNFARTNTTTNPSGGSGAGQYAPSWTKFNALQNSGLVNGVSFVSQSGGGTAQYEGLVSSAAAGYGGIQDGVKFSNLVDGLNAQNGMTIFVVKSDLHGGYTGVNQETFGMTRTKITAGADKFSFYKKGNTATTYTKTLHSNWSGSHGISNGHTSNTLDNYTSQDVKEAIEIHTMIEGKEDQYGSTFDYWQLYKQGMKGMGQKEPNASNLYTYASGWLNVGTVCNNNTCSTQTQNANAMCTVFEIIMISRVLSDAELKLFDIYFEEKYKSFHGNFDSPNQGWGPEQVKSKTATNGSFEQNPNQWGNCLMWYDFTDTSMMWKSSSDTTCDPGVGNGPETCAGYVSPSDNNVPIGRVWNKGYGNLYTLVKSPHWYRNSGTTGASGNPYSAYPGDSNATSSGVYSWSSNSNRSQLSVFMRSFNDDDGMRPTFNKGGAAVNSIINDCINCELELPSITTGAPYTKGGFVFSRNLWIRCRK